MSPLLPTSRSAHQDEPIKTALKGRLDSFPLQSPRRSCGISPKAEARHTAVCTAEGRRLRRVRAQAALHVRRAPSHARRLFDAVASTDKTYVDITGADHDYIERPDLLPAATAAIETWRDGRVTWGRGMRGIAGSCRTLKALSLCGREGPDQLQSGPGSRQAGLCKPGLVGPVARTSRPHRSQAGAARAAAGPLRLVTTCQVSRTSLQADRCTSILQRSRTWGRR
jgi:hypothetical protein